MNKTKTAATRSKSFVGVALAGAKNDKTCLCELQYYPQYQQIAVTQVHEGLGPGASESADSRLLPLIQNISKLQSVAINASLQMPPCVRCRLKCPGIDACRVEEVKWLRQEFLREKKRNKNARMPVPYTDRPTEYFINTQLDRSVEIQYSLSANAAPLTARAFFLAKHIRAKMLEVLPALSVWRIGNFLRVQKSYLKYYKSSEDCELIRLFFLDQAKEKLPLFLYHQDKQKLVSNPQAFDAFVCALTAFFEYRQCVETRPKDFPKKASWMCVPSEDLAQAFVHRRRNGRQVK